MFELLIVEDDIAFAKLLEAFLTKKGYSVVLARNVTSAGEFIHKTKFDLFLLDYRLPDGTAFDILNSIRMKSIDSPVIIMTGFHDVRTVVKAMKLGASDYITKPVNPDELLMVLQQTLEKKESAKTNDRPLVKDFVKGSSDIANRLQEYIDLVSPTDMSVIIQGESGTGKEYVARAIHKASKRSSKPFIPIDCGVLSKDLAAGELFGYVKGAFTGALQDKKGQFEAATGGTLFLDEIGNLSYEVQVKLLRALQEKIVQPVGSDKYIKVDIRLIVATNDNLLNSVENGVFREDLYHRINEFKISVPPLRERGDDMFLFIDHFLAEANIDLSRNVNRLSPEALTILKNYDWPGNLRELRNTIRRMVLLTKGTAAGKEELPEEMLFVQKKVYVETMGVDLKAIQEMTEKEQIVKVLATVGGNKSKAARMLNIDRKTLYNKLEKYGLD
jgi:two-component system, NtrC family, response regulator HydG